jgi:hypothetical protein
VLTAGVKPSRGRRTHPQKLSQVERHGCEASTPRFLA